ncbi:hypothetical protein K7432_017513, partial [Basidiobolus ranarum]
MVFCKRVSRQILIMFSILILLAFFDLSLSAPLPNHCATNCNINRPTEIHAGCWLELQHLIPFQTVKTVKNLKVELYLAGSHCGVVIYQLN